MEARTAARTEPASKVRESAHSETGTQGSFSTLRTSRQTIDTCVCLQHPARSESALLPAIACTAAPIPRPPARSRAQFYGRRYGDTRRVGPSKTGHLLPPRESPAGSPDAADTLVPDRRRSGSSACPATVPGPTDVESRKAWLPGAAPLRVGRDADRRLHARYPRR